MRTGAAEVSSHKCSHFSVATTAPMLILRRAPPKFWLSLRQAWQTSRTLMLASSLASFVIANVRAGGHACGACLAGHRYPIGIESG